ncbi:MULTISPECIES: hypothetical protein [Rhizobium/Agrobacterium group]|uniref:Uncharacterized protein n=2 Tax=Rhizobium/Agrobacterium group TaxID=227290 RepID=B9JRK5_ALLAM|nr:MULTISPECIES: hypothetical protein [Rhizobium/Agrobacterium group]ACM35482.1 hypothetical protein Avi_0679 [Allorhizobium ampelinum S4]MUO28274.1 hypothetical protein [Agrobacterium vitis]MUO40692.1 hypothetical protein [Agrobacterium vitis]MUP12769.1 hypothetical protein [Agrobacterium vitis]
MRSEFLDISETLIWASCLVLHSGPKDRHRIALAYHEAQELVDHIPLNNEDARSRITACFEKFDVCQVENDIACVGWMLMSIQQRVSEQNLYDWRELHDVVQKVVKLLPRPEPTVH